VKSWSSLTSLKTETRVADSEGEATLERGREKGSLAFGVAPRLVVRVIAFRGSRNDARAANLILHAARLMT
jgi:hypothetical protein